MTGTWTMIAALALTGALTGALAGCGGGLDAEDTATDLADVYNEMADVIESITDDDSIDAARPKMRAIGERMKSMREEWEAAAAEGDAEAMWDQGVTKDLMAAQQRMTAAIMKIGMNPELSRKFGEVMQEFGDVFNKR